MERAHEKREYSRFSFEKKILLKFEDDPTNTIEGELIDISFGGLNFFLKGSIDEDAVKQATVKFDVPFLFNQHLLGSGKVVYILPFELDKQNGFRVGIEFTEADKDVYLAQTVIYK